MRDLHGRPIAITGASSGIGRATALACARAGMPVVLGARRMDRLERVCEDIRAAGGKAAAVACDVTSPEDCERLVEVTVAQFGSIHAIFANAGYGLEKPIHLVSDAEMRAIFETNYFGTLNTLRPALPHMLQARAGHLLICASCIGKLGVPYIGSYCATKGAQWLIGQAMHSELKPRGVDVSVVYPVRTLTEFGEVSATVSQLPPVPRTTPLAKAQTAERVAEAIVSCLRKPRPEVWTSLPTRLTFALAMALPAFASRSLDKYAARRRGLIDGIDGEAQSASRSRVEPS